MAYKAFDSQLESIMNDAHTISFIISEPSVKQYFSEIHHRLQKLKDERSLMRNRNFNFELLCYIEDIREIFLTMPGKIIWKMCFHLIHWSIYKFYNNFGLYCQDNSANFIRLARMKNNNPLHSIIIFDPPQLVQFDSIDSTFFGNNISDRPYCDAKWIFTTFKTCIGAGSSTYRWITDAIDRIIRTDKILSINHFYDSIMLVLKVRPQFETDLLFDISVRWFLEELEKFFCSHGIFSVISDVKYLVNLKYLAGKPSNDYYIKLLKPVIQVPGSIFESCQSIHYNGNTFEIDLNKDSLFNPNPVKNSKTSLPVILNFGKLTKITLCINTNELVFEIEESDGNIKCGDLDWFKIYCAENLVGSSPYLYYVQNKKQYAICHYKELYTNDFTTRLNKFLKTHSDMLKESGHYDVFSKLM